MEYCEEYAALLDAYLDGELTEEEALRVREHIEACSGCRRYIEDALAIREILAGAVEEEAPEDFAAQVMEAVRRTPQAGGQKRARQPWRKLLIPLAACCAIVVLQKGGWFPGAGGGNSSGGGEENAAVTADTAGGEVVPYGAESEEAPEEYDGDGARQDGEQEKRTREDGGDVAADAPAGYGVQSSQPLPAAPATPKEPEIAPDAPEHNLMMSPAAAPEMPESVLTDPASASPAEDGAVELDGAAEGAGVNRYAYEVEVPPAAADLLADYPHESAEGGQVRYHLTAEEYGSLLEALQERGIEPSVRTEELSPEGAAAVLVYLGEE